MQDYSHKHVSVRVKLGKEVEERIANKLSKAGYPLRNSSISEDKNDKIDRHLDVNETVKQKSPYLEKHGNAVALQIKKRIVGDDLIVDFFEPYHGEGHPQTRVGRDMAGKYQAYAFEQTNGDTYLADAVEVKEIAKQTHERWLSKGKPHRISKSNNLYWRDPETGAMLIQTRDNHSGTPKLLVYINVSSVKNKTKV